MSEPIFVFHCRSCETPVVGITAAYCDDEGVLVQETRCPICERSLAISIDKGTLDLGLVSIDDPGDFEVFG